MALNKPRTSAVRTHQIGSRLQRRTHSLPSHFHHAKTAYSQYSRTGTVGFDGIAKSLFDFPAVFLTAHVNKVANYQSPQVSQSELTGYFLSITESGAGFLKYNYIGATLGYIF